MTDRETNPASWIAGVVSTAQASPSSVATASAAADAAAQAAGVQQTTYYQQPFGGMTEYHSSPFGSMTGTNWSQQQPQQQQQQQHWVAYEQMRVAAWKAYYAQQQWPVHTQPSAPPPPPPQSSGSAVTAQAAPTANTWKLQFELAQQKEKYITVGARGTSSTPDAANQFSTSQPHQERLQQSSTSSLGRGRGASMNNLPAWMTATTTHESRSRISVPVAVATSTSSENEVTERGKRSRWGNGTAGGPPCRSSTAEAVAAAAAHVASVATRPPEKMSLTTFTEKCMAACRSPAELDLMRQALHKRITDAITQGEVTKDWSTEEAPMTGYVEPTVTMKTLSHVVTTNNGGWNEGKRSKKQRLFERQQQKGIWTAKGEHGDSHDIGVAVSSAEQQQRAERAGRFREDKRSAKRRVAPPSSVTMSAAGIHSSSSLTRGSCDGDDDFDLESLKIVGSCQNTEKSYFRLTSAPDPATVRPEPVLALALSELQSKWRARFDDPPPRGGTGPVEYIWLCDQLKAVRQDLVVQHIKNEFTITVYECHARVALEEGDMNEYNQCQTQLRELYSDPLLKGKGNRAEFTAYRILYYLYLQGNQKYAEGSSDLLSILKELHGTRKGTADGEGLGMGTGVFESQEVQNALGLLRALSAANWMTFWRLADDAPNMGSYILDFMLPKCRLQALRSLLRAYKPSLLPLSFVARMLHFDDVKEEHGMSRREQGRGDSECLMYLQAAGVVLTGQPEVVSNHLNLDEVSVDTKASAGKSLDLDAIAAYEGTSGTLL